MKLLLIVCVAILLLSPIRAISQSDHEIRSSIDSILANWQSTDEPGFSIAIIKNGTLLYQKNSGIANMEFRVPITDSTNFHIASVSKQFTAYLVMTLVQKNLLKTTDNIHLYLPEFFKGKNITINHLLTHTSGIREWQELLWLKNWNRNNLVTPAIVLDLLKDQTTLNNEPGEKFAYSNSNYDLLAEIIRRVTKKSLNEYAAEVLFSAMDMKNTSYRESLSQVIKLKASRVQENISIDL